MHNPAVNLISAPNDHARLAIPGRPDNSSQLASHPERSNPDISTPGLSPIKTQSTEKKDILTALNSNKIFKNIVDISSGVSLLSLFSSGLAEFKLLGLSKVASERLGVFADYANKAFQMLNALKNITTLLPRLDLVNAMGHGLDFIMPVVTPMKDFYLARGAPLGMYVGAHAMNIINEKEKFKNTQEYWDHVITALKKTVKNFTDFGSLPKKFFAHETAMMGVASSFLCLLGVSLWKPLEALIGPAGRSIAAFLRDSGGFLQGLEGMKPGHLASGRVFFALSGYSQFIGALCNLLAETVMKGSKSALDPLSFAFSGLGRWLFRISNDKGEAGLVNAK